MIASTRVDVRSGSSITRPAKSSTSSTTGRHARDSCRRSALAVRINATHSTMLSFASSLGCTPKEPIPSQRREPLTLSPIPRTTTRSARVTASEPGANRFQRR